MNRILVRTGCFALIFLALVALPVLAGGTQSAGGREAGITTPTRSLSVDPNFRATPPQKCEPAVAPKFATPSMNATHAKPTTPWSRIYTPVREAAAAGPAILIYADDYYHPAPNTYVDRALQYWGYGYTAHYDGDFGGFYNDLTGGTAWDLVIFAHENYGGLSDTLLNALNAYVAGGGRVIFQSWEASGYAGSPFFATTGFLYQATNNDPPWSTYWWDLTNPIFTTPMTVPEFTSLTPYRYGSYGQRGDAAPGFTAVAGYVPVVATAFSAPGQAALIVGNGGRTIFKGFLDGQNDANLNENDWPDGEELWINMIGDMLACPSVAVNDGGFENGPPPASAWTEWTNTGCGSWIDNWDFIFGIPPHTGNYEYWAGGYCGGPNSDYAEQSMALPASSALTLKFWTVFYRLDADDAFPDTFYVNVNGTQVFAKPMVQAENTFPNWVQQEVDLTAYQGQTVTLRFGGDSQGSSTGNVLVDDVTLSVCPFICPAITLSPATLPTPIQGVPYSQTITASGGTGPYTFAVTAGALPAGLTLSAAGLLSGTMTSLAPTSFTITATDTITGCTGDEEYSLSTFSAFFKDDYGRSLMCVNRLTGAYSYQILLGPSAGVYTGTAVILNSGTKIVSAVGAPDRLNVTYDPIRKKASGYFMTAAGGYCPLVDANTANNTGGCTAAIPD